MRELWYETYHCLSDAVAAGRHDWAAVIVGILERMDETAALNPDFCSF